MPGELQDLKRCLLCPRECRIDRERNVTGFCEAKDKIKVARAAVHLWEEPFLSGGRGSGTVFFSGCNLKCVYCQNREISFWGKGTEIEVDALVEIFFKLSEISDNINLVTPTHYSEKIRKAIEKAKNEGLNVPFVYNTSSYESVDNIRAYEGLIDIYLPDLKYFDDTLAIRYSKAPNYFKHATACIKEMLRQVGHLEIAKEGLARSGLAIRHLVLPGLVDDSKKVLSWIRDNLGKYVYLSLMAQYFPPRDLKECPELSRRLTQQEYETIVEEAANLGFQNVYIQEMDSATDEFVPDFNERGMF